MSTSSSRCHSRSSRWPATHWPSSATGPVIAMGAAEVKALRKPSLTAWALNQVSRDRPTDIDRLLEAGEQLREAQHGALEGDPTLLRDARRAFEDEVDRVDVPRARCSAGPARRGSRRSSTASRSTLRATATDDEARRAGPARAASTATSRRPGSGSTSRRCHPSPPGGPRPRPRRPCRRHPAPIPAPARHDHRSWRLRRLATLAERAEARARRLLHEADEAERHAGDLRRQADEAVEAAAGARRAADEAGPGTASEGSVP